MEYGKRMKQLAAIPFFCIILNAGPEKYRGQYPVKSAPDGNFYLEAEEFSLEGLNGWKAQRWGENYYAATFANSFLSRKGFLGAPEQVEKATASITTTIDEAGQYLVLVRYEAAYRFQTQFRIEVEQDGKRIFNRLYGARENIKIWAFGQKLKTELAWSWGASENIVWEGHNALTNLKPGIATIRLIAAKQPTPAARRNVDLILLTRNKEEVLRRIDSEKYLPLDGLLTQQGDLHLRITNKGTKPLKLTAKNGTEHSPYWVHQRSWKPLEIKVPAGNTSEWNEVGHLLDTLNDGQWDLNINPPGDVTVEFAVTQTDGSRKMIHSLSGHFDTIPLAYDANTRYTQRIRDRKQILHQLLDHLDRQKEHGRIPTETLIFANSFKTEFDEQYSEAALRFRNKFGITQTDATSGTGKRNNGYIDVRNVRTDKLAEYCQNLGPRAKKIATVSLGDEITLPKPGGKDAEEAFRQWMQSKGLSPADASKDSSKWSNISLDLNPGLRNSNPNLFYWSRRYQHQFGILKTKERTDILRKHLPNAGIGANYSPHYPTEHRYLGEVHKWVTTFRQEAMTQPWSEDYIFQMPVCTPQVNNINLDLLRAGVRGKAKQKIHYYCMAHWPSNRPDTWRRLFYGALGHGMQIVNLFEFRPVQVAYTENHVTHKDTYAEVLKAFRELGTFEHIVQTGRPRFGQAALWFSETSDIWGDNEGSFAAAKRTLYTAIRQQEIPLDFLVEADATAGTLAKYKVLYLTDRHVSNAASKHISEWVKNGGILFCTAGAGMFDEYNNPNASLRSIQGVDLQSIIEPEKSQVSMVKQDLPFAKPIDTIKWNGGRLEIFGAKAILQPRKPTLLSKKAKILASFPNGSPALIKHPSAKGTSYTCAFLPGLSYYRNATPMVPVDRSSSIKSLIHFLPTQFNDTARILIDLPAKSLTKPVRCSAPLIESCILDSPKGTAIVLVNWTREIQKGLTVILGQNFPPGPVRLASGQAVNRSGNRLTLDLNIAESIIFNNF